MSGGLVTPLGPPKHMTPIATASDDVNRTVTLWARIPEPLDDLQRQATYDAPLSRILLANGIQAVVRGFSIPPTADAASASVGVEIRGLGPEAIAVVGQALVDLGAAPSMVLELETDIAAMQLTLADAGGR